MQRKLLRNDVTLQQTRNIIGQWRQSIHPVKHLPMIKINC